MFKRSMVMGAAVLLMLCVAIQVAEACSCSEEFPEPSVEELISRESYSSGFIFTARVKSVREVQTPVPSVVVSLGVMERFKGLSRSVRTVTIVIPSEVPCKYDYFEARTKVLVYADDVRRGPVADYGKWSTPPMWVPFCSRTRTLAYAAEDLAILRRKPAK